jgi:hypothetical protein
LDLQEFPQAFPIWTETRNSRWEGRLAWKGDLNWEAIIRRNGESANSVMLKLGSEERNWKGLIHSCRLDLFRSSPDNSFRYVGGDFLQRSGRTLHGRGALLSGTLRINWQDFSLRLNSDAGPGLSPRLGLSLYWQPA